MISNAVIKTLLDHKSIRRYTEESPADEVIQSVVRAGQQAPFVSQLYSVILSRDRSKHPFEAPLLFTICVDVHKLERVMARRGWKLVTNDLSLLVFGIQDAAYMAENMVIAGRSLGLGSCFLGGAPYRAGEIAEDYKLPNRVFPLVQLAMGYPAEEPPCRPRYPLGCTVFEDEYPILTDDMVERAMREMDDGYMKQEYYRRAGLMLPLEDGREETHTFDTYGWTEHISRKWGQWHAAAAPLLEQLRHRGFRIGEGEGGSDEVDASRVP
jgi:nitroreductase